MEQFALLPGEREHRDEGENDDGHGEENRPADLLAGDERGLPCFLAGEFAAFFLLRALAMAEDVLGDDDGGIHQHADGNCDAG